MKHKKFLKIVGCIVSVVVIFAVSFGVFFGVFNRNDNSTFSAYADELYTTETVTNTYYIYAPDNAFPITLYGYNGTSKRYVTLSSSGGSVEVKTVFKYDVDYPNDPEYRFVVAEGTITYFYAVDSSGCVLFIDLDYTDACVYFPFAATYPNGYSVDIYLTYKPIYLDDILDSYTTIMYNAGYNTGYTGGYNVGYGDGLIEGYDEGYELGYSDGGGGYNVGYEEGFNEGYDIGHTYGYDDGYELGYSDGGGGYNVGYEEGYYEGYDMGYYTGHEVGSEEGTQLGYDYGYSTGYLDGHNEGYNLGLSEQISFSPISVFLTPVHDFLNAELFGSFTIGSMFNIVLFVAVALIFIKMFAG